MGLHLQDTQQHPVYWRGCSPIGLYNRHMAGGSKFESMQCLKGADLQAILYHGAMR